MPVRGEGGERAMSGEEIARRVLDSVWEQAEPVVEAEGLELVEVEYRREPQGWVLRLFVDGPQGVTVDDCARASRVVGDLLDVSDPIDHPYHLEVSSPGLDRPLRKPEHFRRQVGSVVEIRTSVPPSASENRRRFKGILLDVDARGVRVDCYGQGYEIPFSVMERSRLRYFESDPSGGEKGGRGLS